MLSKKSHIKMINSLVPIFIEKAQERCLYIESDFACHLLNLLQHDLYDGLDIDLIKKKGTQQPLSICKYDFFLNTALDKFQNEYDATICHMKMSYYLQHCQSFNLVYIKEKYEEKFQHKLDKLLADVLQYPENSNNQQLDEMFVKIQIFIIANYKIGNTNDDVLLKQTKQYLNNIICKEDLENYVFKKHYHRLEYLKRLSAITAGILIYNNYLTQDELKNEVHSTKLFDDLDIAQNNMKISLDTDIENLNKFIGTGSDAMKENIIIDAKHNMIYCFRPIAKIREINRYVALFNDYRHNLQHIKKTFEKTQFLIKTELKKFDCVINKINSILNNRSILQSELIFPHFVYLSELWTTLILHLNHVTELNSVKDHLNNLINEELINEFEKILQENDMTNKNIKPVEIACENVLTNIPIVLEQPHKIIKCIKKYFTDYCTLTMALTNGLLIPAKVQKKSSLSMDTYFGFANLENAKFAEKHFDIFIKALLNVIVGNTDLILLFQIEQVIIQHNLRQIEISQPKSKTLHTQTEFVIENDLSVPNHINVTWNIWDYHRETIRMADIRQRQTHSTQTNLLYGKRNAQNQTYYTRAHKSI